MNCHPLNRLLSTIHCPLLAMSSPSNTLATDPLDVPREEMPRHIAVIMDGNGRWAKQQGLPRIEGHRQGVASVRRTTEECARLGIEQLTLYCLSSENWKRPPAELEFLMHLLGVNAVGKAFEVTFPRIDHSRSESTSSGGVPKRTDGHENQ